MDNRIEITSDAVGYYATYSGPHALHIFELFGTVTLPLPFTSLAQPAVVFQDVAMRNPSAIISMRGTAAC